MSGPNSKPELGLQTYRTPPAFLAALCRRLALPHIDWDLACSRHDCVGVSGGYMYPEVDALAQDWSDVANAFHDGLAFCNPEFAQSGAFAAKAASTPELRAALLVPVALGTRWWRAHVHHKANVIGIGRMKFLLPDGTPMPAAINRDLAVCVYGAGTMPGMDGADWYELEDWRQW